MTATVKRKTPLTVPDSVRRRAGFKPGDRVQFKVSLGVVTICTRNSTARTPDNTLTREEAKKVRHAIRQVREGITTRWSQVKNELGL